MTTFEIINPHDKYTITAPDFVTALAAIALIGEGRYGIIGGGVDSGLALFSDYPPATYEAAGVKDSAELFDVESGRLNTDPAFNEAVAAACESIKCVGKRTSTADLKKNGKLIAEALRSQRTFASAETEA